MEIYLYKSGERIAESLHDSRYTGSFGYAVDQGGVTLVSRDFYNYIIQYVTEH